MTAVNSSSTGATADSTTVQSESANVGESVNPGTVNLMTKQLLQRVREVRWLLAMAIALNVIGGGMLIIQCYGIAKIVNGVFLGHASLQQNLPWLWTLFIVILVRAALRYGAQIFASELSIRVKTSLRRQLLLHIMKLGPAFTNGVRRGDLVNTAMAGIEQLEDFLSKYLPQMALAVLLPLAFLASVLTQDWLTALILAVTAPLIVFFMILVGKLAESASAKQWRQLSTLAAWFLDLLQGLTTLKLFGRSKAQVQWMGRASEAYRTATMRTLRVAFLSSFLLELFATLGTAVVAVSLGLRLVAGDIPFVTALFVLLLTPEFYQPIRALGSEFHAGMNGVVAVQSVFDILDSTPPGMDVANTSESENVDEQEHAGSDDTGVTHAGPEWDVPVGRANRVLHNFEKLELRSVSFSYTKDTAAAVSDINLQIGAGRHIAIVGRSGSGKSTLLDLIQGFLTPGAGGIFVNDMPLKEVAPQAWRQNVAALRQHAHLFSTTVRANLLMAKPAATTQEMEAAATTAQAHEFIMSLPNGYDTVVGEGGMGLSGGQIQRIAIARALLKNAPVILLDEPTRHLDAATERLVYMGLEELMRNRTVFVVAHRLSTIRKADEILVLDAGRLVQQGHHDDLLQQPGLYREMYIAQGEVNAHA